jgi:hypothetical protein
MNEEQQRIALAEFHGYRNIALREDPDEGFDPLLTGFKNGNHFDEQIPDYLNDLKAMHELVKTLPRNIKHRYFACLCFVVSGAISLNGYSEATEATAANRAEAVLRTIDKWTTNQNEL